MISFNLIYGVNNKPYQKFGSVQYEYFISTYPITNQEYCNFLNSQNRHDIFHYDKDQVDNGITRVITTNKIFYIVKPGYENKPVLYTSYYDNILFINWLNQSDNIFYMPSIHEWIKAGYYDPSYKKYSKFPDKTDNNNIYNTDYSIGYLTENGIHIDNCSFYGIYDMLGNIYERCFSTDNNSLSPIMGASWNRSGENAQILKMRLLNKNIFNHYVGFRICRKYIPKTYKILLYNEFGDGWKGDSISIIDNYGATVCDNITLKYGSGPEIYNFNIFSQKQLIIRYNNKSNTFYENRYEILDNYNNKIYDSKEITNFRQDRIIDLIDK